MYDIHQKLILRTPRLSLDHFSLETDTSDQARSDSFMEALYLASPDLVQSLQSNGKGKISAASNAIAKYFIRSCFRPTPFGMFAGVSVAEWGNNTNIVFEGELRHTRLDLQYLEKIAKHLVRVPEIKKTINFSANNSIYTCGDKLRYIEYSLAGNRRNYSLSEVEIIDELRQILAVSAMPVSYQALVDILTSKGYPQADAQAFIDELIDNQILISELEPCITGDDYLDVLIGKLSSRGIKDLETVIKVLERARSLMKSLDATPGGIKAYKTIKTQLRQLPLNNDSNNFFHVDLLKTTSKRTLGLAIRRTVKQGVEVLLKLAGKPKNDKLEEFKARFTDRYGEKEMPLLEVLDGDIGIGYPDLIEGDVTSLTNGVIVSPEADDVQVAITKRDTWLQRKLHHALFHDDYGITIEPNELAEFQTNWDMLPPSFSAIFRVTNFSENEIYIEGVGGSSAIQTLGRFAYADDEIKDLISDIIEVEKRSHTPVIIAEIVHLPDSRIGNVLTHPSFYRYEIPYLTSPSPKAQTIRTQELYLRIEAGKITLISKELNQEIIPRLSNANNFKLSALPVYQFLCDLQTENCLSNISFNWGPLSQEPVFLPRVTYGKAILHAATWCLERSEFESLLRASPDNLVDGINEFKGKWRMPRFIALIESDEELVIDLNNSKSVLAWISTIRQKQKIVLKEYLFDPDPAIRDKEGGRYVNQFIATLTKQSSIASTNRDSKIARNVPVLNRSYYPGTEWVYFKVYCNIKSTDEVLVKCIKPLTAKLLKDKLIEGWFFVRYKDPHPHLRIRLKLAHVGAFNTVVQMTNAYLKAVTDETSIRRIQLDTYERELERYGVFMLQAEIMFFYDSIAIAKIVHKMCKNREKEELRWLLSIRIIDQTLTDFAFSPDEKIALMERVKSTFSKEFNIQKQSQIEIDKKYRHFKPDIESIIKGHDKHHLNYLIILKERSKKMQPIIRSIRQTKFDETSAIQSIDPLVESFIHLSLNRLLSHTHRLQERIIYDFMLRFYTSEKAKLQSKKAMQPMSRQD